MNFYIAQDLFKYKRITIMNFKTITNLLVFGLLCNFVAHAQKTAFEMSELMTRGINIGNTLDAENYEGGWAPAASEKDFDAIKKAGFTCVRIPITWGATLSKNDPTPRVDTVKPYKINKIFLDRVDSLVKWSLDRGLVTVINVHHEKWLKSRHTFDEKSPRFYSIWEQLSKHYKDYPEELLFEILNEPHHETNGEKDGLTQEQVDGLNVKVLSIIRKKNPSRIAIYSGCTWSSILDLQNTAVPDTTDKYLMGTYHSYSPWNFAGEGNGTWGTNDDKKEMKDEFTNLLEYSKKHNVPVFIGEYAANQRCEYNSRMKHYAFYMEHIQKHTIAGTTWDDSGHRFKILNKETRVWDDAKDILVNYTFVSPDSLTLQHQDNKVIDVKWRNRTKNIDKITIERRVGRIGDFVTIATIGSDEKYTDASEKKFQTTYYYRVVNYLKDGSKLISYPQRIYLP